MDELFEKCLKQVLKWEGGYVNDPDDNGGATKMGITQYTYNAFLKRKGLALKPVKNISYDEVKEIYYTQYWLKSGCDKMSKQFAALCFDTAVNMGTEVVKATGMTRNAEFLKAAQYKYPAKYIAAKREKYFAFARVGNQRKYLNGWLNRLNDMEKFIKTL